MQILSIFILYFSVLHLFSEIHSQKNVFNLQSSQTCLHNMYVLFLRNIRIQFENCTCKTVLIYQKRRIQILLQSQHYCVKSLILKTSSDYSEYAGENTCLSLCFFHCSPVNIWYKTQKKFEHKWFFFIWKSFLNNILKFLFRICMRNIFFGS